MNLRRAKWYLAHDSGEERVSINLLFLKMNEEKLDQQLFRITCKFEFISLTIGGFRLFLKNDKTCCS